ncbi:MAG: hypothetical protein EPO11_08935 [Gammaproteobacteria bacterium]|nr:MAG: hypothetical protein EPO11_08935 [Gammaproteobacteria bacterium]
MNKLPLLFLATSLWCQTLFAAPSYCIGIYNQSSKPIQYQQWPDNFGSEPVAAYQKTQSWEVLNNSEAIVLRNQAGNTVLASTVVQSGTTIAYFGEDHDPSWAIQPGC